MLLIDVYEHCDILHSFGLSFYKIHRRQPSWIYRVVRFSVNHREETRSQSYATLKDGIRVPVNILVTTRMSRQM